MKRRLIALLAIFYAAAILLWVVGLARGWTAMSRGESLYVFVVGLYAVLSFAAAASRPDDARVRVFLLSLAAATLTIVWPTLDLWQPNPVLLWFTMGVGAFVYALPFALYVHLAALIPTRHRWIERHRWVLPAHYAVAVAVGAGTALMYASEIPQLAGAGAPGWLPLHLSLDTAFRVDGLLNVGGYAYAGLASLVLLGTAAAGHRVLEGRRQALVVFAGLIPWTLYMVYELARMLFHSPQLLSDDWTLTIEAGTVLIEAAALFVAILGFQLFEIGLVVRKGLISGAATGLLIGLLYLLTLSLGQVTTHLFVLDLSNWQLAVALLVVGMLIQPAVRAASRVIDRVFFPEKVRLDHLRRHLIPALSQITDLDRAAAHVVRRMRRSLQLRGAALLLPDETREFYRVRAVAGSFDAGAAARGAVLTGDDLRTCWPGPDRHVLTGAAALAGRNGCAELSRMFELVDADYIVPFQLGNELVAILTLSTGRTRGMFDRDDLREIEVLAQQASAMLENARLFQLARHDRLTGLPRRRVFEERLGLELGRVRRNLESFAVGMIDIDDFKSINDRFGHLVGDRVLRAIADRLRAHIRSIDVVARYGGEEFVLLLTQTDVDGALTVAEKLRDAVAAEPIPIGDGSAVVVTLSIGVTVAEPADIGHDGQEFVRRADHALYQAKLAGKNRVRHFGGAEDDSDAAGPLAPISL